jgi:4-diphosphocytidyl-2-C-methyl-D-erythritol kinase
MQMLTHEDRFLCLYAPAKVNLFLRILARRPDGYHELETRMQKLGLSDRITLTLREGSGIQLRCTQVDLPADETNLAWRAAAAFFAVSRQGTQYGVDITLEKNIPVAAGLGGGSSDAGAVLKGLNILFGNEFSEDVLLDIGRRLGADVPFFVTGHEAVLATGIGEKMMPVHSLNTCTFLLVNPGFTVSTRWAYENYALTRDTKNSTLPGFRKLAPDPFLLTEITNDLEQVTISRYPEIAEIKKRLRDAGAAAALMSGSGPTVFGVFPDEVRSHQFDITSVSQKLRREYGDKIFVVRAGVGA